MKSEPLFRFFRQSQTPHPYTIHRTGWKRLESHQAGGWPERLNQSMITTMPIHASFVLLNFSTGISARQEQGEEQQGFDGIEEQNGRGSNQVKLAKKGNAGQLLFFDLPFEQVNCLFSFVHLSHEAR